MGIDDVRGRRGERERGRTREKERENLIGFRCIS